MTESKKQILNSLLSQYSHFMAGSLPYKDPKEAAEFILSRPYILPCWPELPRRANSEFMFQRAAGLMEAHWKGSGFSDDSAAAVLRSTLTDQNVSLDIFKGQICGAFTLHCNSDSMAESFSFYQDRLLEGYLQHISEQCNYFKSITKNFLIVFDEPTIGSSIQSQRYHPKMFINFYEKLIGHINNPHVFVGIHTCGPFSEAILGIPFELYSFQFDESQSVALKSFAKVSDLPVLVPGCFKVEAGGDLWAERSIGENNFQVFKSRFEEFSGDKVVTVLASAECGHANSSLEWLNLLYPPMMQF